MADLNMVDRLKQRCKIEDIIEADGYHLTGSGRYRKCEHRKLAGLVVDLRDQRYFWNGQDESGDVINWRMTRQACDFKTAYELLCRQVGLPEPEWSKEDVEQRIATRQKEDVFEVAKRVFCRWLWADPDALAYARGRGWTDDTIHLYELGYTGTKENRKRLTDELRSEISMSGGDPECPAAVALMGLTDTSSRLTSWAKTYGVDAPIQWAEKGFIPSMVARDMLIYPHVYYGRTIYFSGRGIHEKGHNNIPTELVGDRPIYFNRAYMDHDQECVVVEGQADAITLGQLGIPAVALAGVEAPEDLSKQIKRPALYMGLDNDHAGRVKIGLEPPKPGKPNNWKRAFILGPMCRLVSWGEGTYNAFVNAQGEEQPVKDANDMLKSMDQKGVSFYPEKEEEVDKTDKTDYQAMTATQALEYVVNRRQGEIIRNTMMTSRTYVETMAEWAASQKGNARDKAIEQTASLIGQMKPGEYDLYRSKLSKALEMSTRDLTKMVKTMKDEKSEDDDDTITKYTLGGYIDGHVVEYLYDPEEGKASLAWRTPKGEITSGDSLLIGKVKYLPDPPSSSIIKGGILFPSALGDAMSTSELITTIELFLKSVYIMPRETDVKIICYYILLTWVFDCFDAIPYLRAQGEPGSGKSELMRRVALLCNRRLMANAVDTPATLFRMIEKYSPTLYMDEMDLKDSDASNDLVKLLTLGNMKDNYITRLNSVMDADGGKHFEEEMHATFCPKLIAMQRDFKDKAVSSRCLTFKLTEANHEEIKRKNIPLNITTSMKVRSLAIRNLLIRWRLKTWEPLIEIPMEMMDDEISLRLNQVTGALLIIAKDDPQLQAEIKRFMREYYEELKIGNNMTYTARVIEAYWKIHLYPDLRQKYVIVEADKTELTQVKNIAEITNQIIAEMDGFTKENSQDGGNKLTPHFVGGILRNDMQLLAAGRKSGGIHIIWDEEKMIGLARRFGINPADIGPQAPAPEIKQGGLL